MALWKSMSLNPEQKAQLVEDETETKSLQSDNSGCFIGMDDVKMSEVFHCLLPLNISLVMELYKGGDLEQRVMKKVGCLEYSVSPWETVTEDVCQRQVQFKLGKTNLFKYKITSTQKKTTLTDRNGWVIEEVMAVESASLGDYFNLHLRYHIEDQTSEAKACLVQASIGIAWLKSTMLKKKITQNVMASCSSRINLMFSALEELTHPNS